MNIPTIQFLILGKEKGSAVPLVPNFAAIDIKQMNKLLIFQGIPDCTQILKWRLKLGVMRNFFKPNKDQYSGLREKFLQLIRYT